VNRALDYLAMGGYAAYVWPAFGVAAAVLGGLLAASLRTLRARRAALEAMRPSERSGADDDEA
jgi:heme exporter protein D